MLEQEKPQPFPVVFDISKQMILCQELILTFGYDLNPGRIDKAVHPFFSGSSSDVRIATRTIDKNPLIVLFYNSRDWTRVLRAEHQP